MNDECGQRTYANKGSQQFLQCFPWQIEPGMRRKLCLSCMNLAWASCNLGKDTILACKRCEDFENWRSTFPFLQGMIYNETTWAMTMIFASNQWFCSGTSLSVMETRPCAQAKSLPVVRPFWSVWNQPERVRHLAHTKYNLSRHKVKSPICSCSPTRIKNGLNW